MASTTSVFSKIFNPDEMWNVMNAIDNIPADDNPIGMVITLAASMAAFLWAFQLGVITVKAIRSGSQTLMPEIMGHIALGGFYGLIANSVGYGLLMKLIAYPASTIAGGITKFYIKGFTSSWISLFQNATGETNPGILTILKVGFDLIPNIITSIIFFVAAICAFITPLLQQSLFMLAYFMGPIMLSFMLCDYTRQIAWKWFGFAMSIAYLGVVGSCTFLVAHSMGVYAKLGENPSIENIIVLAVYGIITILLFVSAFPLSQFLFGGGGIGNMTNPIAAGGVAMGVGAAMSSVAGGALSRVGSEGSKTAAVGQYLSNIGKSVTDNSRDLKDVSAGAKNTFGLASLGGRVGSYLSGQSSPSNGGKNSGSQSSVGSAQRFSKQESATPGMKSKEKAS